MASILKVRDKNGHIVDIPVIKGDKGDSYVLTEADKISIKDAVISELDIPAGSVAVVHELPTEAADGDMCLYAPMNTITLEDGGKRIYFDWEEFAKPIDSEDFLYAGAVTNNNNSWGGGLAVELAGFRSSTMCYMTIMLYTQIGTHTSYYIAFNNGQFDAENSSYQIHTGDTVEEHHFNSIDELPLYVTLPEFDFINAAENTAGNIFVFCTEYRLMKYQGGEWGEVFGTSTKDYIDNALAEINARIDEVAGGIDEIEAMIDESGVLDE